MDLKQLEYILKIAEENNITRAAEKLYLTQSALNQQLLKLERELGVPLFYRSRTDWRPTPAGEIYLETAKKILLLKQEAYNRIYDIAETQKGTLTVGLTPGRGIDMFTAVYPVFHTAFPHIHVEPLERNVRDQQALIQSGSLDLGFLTLLKSQRKTGIEYIELGSEELVLAMPASLAEKGGFPDRPDQTANLTLLRDYPFVFTNRSSTMRAITDSIFRSAGFNPHILFETTNNNTILSIIRAGICCGIIPMYYVDQTDPKIRFFPLPGRPEWDMAAAVRKGHYMSRAAREFISLAGQYFKR